MIMLFTEYFRVDLAAFNEADSRPGGWRGGRVRENINILNDSVQSSLYTVHCEAQAVQVSA